MTSDVSEGENVRPARNDADNPLRLSPPGSRSLPRRAIDGLMPREGNVPLARVQGERTRVVGQYEPRGRRLGRRFNPLGGRRGTARESSIGFTDETRGRNPR